MVGLAFRPIEVIRVCVSMYKHARHYGRVQCYKYRVGEYIAKGPKRNYRIYRQTSAIYRQNKKYKKRKKNHSIFEKIKKIEKLKKPRGT